MASTVGTLQAGNTRLVVESTSATADRSGVKPYGSVPIVPTWYRERLSSGTSMHSIIIKQSSGQLVLCRLMAVVHAIVVIVKKWAVLTPPRPSMTVENNHRSSIIIIIVYLKCKGNSYTDTAVGYSLAKSMRVCCIIIVN